MEESLRNIEDHVGIAQWTSYDSVREKVGISFLYSQLSMVFILSENTTL